MWQWYESAPVADIAVNRHPCSISSLESLSTSKYPQLPVGQRCHAAPSCDIWHWNMNSLRAAPVHSGPLRERGAVSNFNEGARQNDDWDGVARAQSDRTAVQIEARYGQGTRTWDREVVGTSKYINSQDYSG